MPFIPFSGTNKSSQLGTAFGKGLGGIGQGFGEHINQGLEMLAQQKMNKMNQSQIAKGLEPFYGKEFSQALAMQDPKTREQILQNPYFVQKGLSLNKDQGQKGIQALPGLKQQGQPPSQPNLLAAQDFVKAVMNMQGLQDPEEAFKIIEATPDLLEEFNRISSQPSEQIGTTLAEPQFNDEAERIAEGNLSPHERRSRQELGLKQESVRLKQLAAVQPQLTKIEDNARPQRSILRDAESILELIDGAITGPAGKIVPSYFQTPQGQRLDQLLNSIVVQKAQTGKGQASVRRLEAERGAKAQPWQNASVIRDVVRDIITDPELIRDISRDEAREELLEKYGGNIPDNLLPEIDKLAKQKAKLQEKTRAESVTKNDLPDASKLKDGKIAENPFTGKDEWIVRNHKWERI